MGEKFLISNIIKLNGFSTIKEAKNILNRFLGLKYSYIQLDLLLVSKYGALHVLNQNVLIGEQCLRIRKM